MCEILSNFPDTQKQQSAIIADTPYHGKHVCDVCVFSQSSEFLAGYLDFQLPTGEQSAAMLNVTLDPPTSWILQLNSEEADHLPFQKCTMFDT
jgi:hypothetical protein